MTLAKSYRQGCVDALRKFALEAPTPVDTMLASIDQAPDVAPPASPMLPQQLPPVPPEIAAQPHPMEAAPGMNGKEAELGLQQLLLLEKAMGGMPQTEALMGNVERQMRGQGGGRTGTLHIGKHGPVLQPRQKPPGLQAPKFNGSSLGAQAADSVITSAKRPMPGIRAR